MVRTHATHKPSSSNSSKPKAFKQTKTAMPPRRYNLTTQPPRSQNATLHCPVPRSLHRTIPLRPNHWADCPHRDRSPTTRSQTSRNRQGKPQRPRSRKTRSPLSQAAHYRESTLTTPQAAPAKLSAPASMAEKKSSSAQETSSTSPQAYPTGSKSHPALQPPTSSSKKSDVTHFTLANRLPGGPSFVALSQRVGIRVSETHSQI